jgi:hypothetical protein
MIVPRAAALASFLTEQNVALAELFRWSTSQWIFLPVLVFAARFPNNLGALAYLLDKTDKPFYHPLAIRHWKARHMTRSSAYLF